MCFKNCYRDFENKNLEGKDKKEVYENIVCNSCGNSCYTNYLFKNYQGINGFCNSCWEDLVNFTLDSL